MADCFRTRLRAGERLIGPMVTLSSPEVVELFAELGFDWLFIDAEHTPMEAAQLQRLLQAAHPLIAAGIADHSQFRSSARAAVARLHGTVRAMLALAFGDPAEHARSIERIRFGPVFHTLSCASQRLSPRYRASG